MFEVTVVLCNIFHRGCPSVGNVRPGYTSSVRDSSSKANWWEGGVGGGGGNGLVLTDINKNLWGCLARRRV